MPEGEIRDKRWPMWLVGQKFTIKSNNGESNTVIISDLRATPDGVPVVLMTDDGRLFPWVSIATIKKEPA